MADDLDVSIVLCTYRGGDHLAEQLDSLVRQDRPPGELVVCDDASPDDTLDVARRFAADAPFPVRVLGHADNVGITANFARGLAEARGRFVLPCDQDDVWHADKVRRLVAPLEADAAVSLSFADAELADEGLRPLGRRLSQNTGLDCQRAAIDRDPFRALLQRNVVMGASMALRRDALAAGLPIPGGAGWVHDAWLALVCAALGKVVYVDAPLMLYRQHPNQAISAGDDADGTLARGEAARRHYARLARQSRTLVERLDALGPRVDSRARRLAVARLKLCDARLAMRDCGPLASIALALRQLAAGRYHRVARGFRSVAADVVAR